jgi:hypothetical protein
MKNINNPAFVKDMLLTLFAAVMTGVSGGILLILLVFSCGSVEAETLQNSAAQLQLEGLVGRRIEAAPRRYTEDTMDPLFLSVQRVD